MGNEDNIEYSGPDRNYPVSTGGNPSYVPKALTKEAVGGYSNLDWLKQQIDKVIALSTEIVTDFTNKLEAVALPITTNDQDTKLLEALRSEWPVDAGTLPKFIPYRYYRQLEGRNTSAATYIRQRWETAARGVMGQSKFDLVPIAEMIRSEALQVKEFLATYVGTVNDSSEQRTVELLQDWAASGLERLTRVQSIGAANAPPRQFPSSEVESARPEEAAQFQAVFRVKLNTLNGELGQIGSNLKKNWSDYSDAFYNRFLGPALDFRLNVTRNLYPSNSEIGREVGLATGALDSNLSMLLADQIRRNETFNTKTDDYLDKLNERDVYRGYIKQLSSVGKVANVSPVGNVIQVAPSDLEDFPGFIEGDEGFATPNFSPSHNSLADLDNPLAHSQYFLKDGDTLTGDLELAEGVKVGGIVPSSHEHNGEDGSTKIHGSNIVGGTLLSGAVDTTAAPNKPTGLRLVRFISKVLPPGIPLFDAVIEWEGSNQYRYDVQITRIDE
jgi:hypothetical protein